MRNSKIKLVYFSFFSLAVSSAAFAALTEYKTDAGGIWSESSTWNVNPTSTFPNSNSVAAVGNTTNGGTLIVDGNYTIGAFYTGYSAKTFNISIEQDKILTLDGAMDSAKKVITMWSGGTRTDADNLTISGGALKLTDTSDTGNSTLVIDMARNNPATFVKYLNINSSLSSTEHLSFTGYTNNTAVANLNSGILAQNGSDTKNVSLSAATINMGGTSSKIGSLNVSNKSIFTLQSGSSIEIAPTSPLQTQSTNYSVLNSADSVININGAMNVKTIASTDCFRNSGKVIVSETGSLKISGSGWNNFNLYDGATLDISSGKNSVILPGSLRMSNKSTLILRGSNAINTSESDTCNAIIQISSSGGNHRIELYADNQLGSFAFASNSTLTILFGEGCSEFVLTDLSRIYQDGSWLGTLSERNANIVFENFRNDTVRIVNSDLITQGDLDRISAAGFSDFFVTEDGYINAVAIPEPAFGAAFLALVSTAFIAARRRNKR